MSWFGTLFARRELPAELAERLALWRRLPVPQADAVPRRWVVLDTETSGLDTARGRLISIGAVALEDEAIVVAPAFEVVLRQARPSARENIALHGIGAGAQAHGEDPAGSLLGFLEFARKDPLVAWHAGFDAAFLRRALKTHLGLRLEGEWLDLALLVPRTLAGPIGGRRPRPGTELDDWLARFGIDPGERHNALADTYASAQLFQVALRRAGCDGQRRLRDVLDLAGELAADRRRGSPF